VSDSLDQLAEQAAERLHMRLTPRDVLVHELKRLAEAATQALREQLEQAQARRDELAAILDTVGEALTGDATPDDCKNWTIAAVQALSQRAEAAEQERDALKAQRDRLKDLIEGHECPRDMAELAGLITSEGDPQEQEIPK